MKDYCQSNVWPKKFISWITFAAVCAALLFGSFALADSGWFVNDGSELLPEFFDGVYAIGSDGTELLSGEHLYALTSGGLRPLGAANSVGGGGLYYTDGRISVSADTVRVGLNYYYSASRDTSLASASLRNSSGGGFEFGAYDPESGELISQAVCAAASVTVTPNGSGVSVCETGSGSPVFLTDSGSRTDYLIVRPIAVDGAETTVIFNGRNYRGDFGFPVAANGKLNVVNILDIEPYVMGVCACEMTESWPAEALKAQAVAARTYVQKLIGNSVYHYTCGFDVTADTYCQAYRGTSGVGENIVEAVEETANLYLTFDGKLVDALYSASDGGATESNFNVYGTNAYPYLTGVFDPFESAAAEENPYSAWQTVLTPAELGAKLGIGPVISVEPTFSETDNVIKLDFVSASGQTATVIRDSCRTVLGLKNIHYTVEEDVNGNFVFSGSGFGHNLGMSQWGAYAMAKYYEKGYQEILGFYYTGVGLSYGVLE